LHAAFASLNLIELCESYHIHIINDQPVDTAVNAVDEETVDAEQPTADVPDDVQGDTRVEEAEANDDEKDDETMIIMMKMK